MLFGKPALADSLLSYVQAFNLLAANLQKKEYTNINTQQRTEYSRMQLVMITGLPGSRFRDVGRAQSLIDEHLKSPDSHDEGLRSLALIMKSQLAEQQRLEEALPSLTQKLADEQKKTESLQRKLDELLAVEKAMTERRRSQPK